MPPLTKARPSTASPSARDPRPCAGRHELDRLTAAIGRLGAQRNDHQGAAVDVGARTQGDGLGEIVVVQRLGQLDRWLRVDCAR
jgi:hypothetical protein